MTACSIFDRAWMLCDVPVDVTKDDGLMMLIVMLFGICWLMMKAIQSGE